MASSEIEALATAQREFARLVTALEGVDAALTDGGDSNRLGAWLRGDRAIPARERVGIYASAYFSRIHGALRDDYGALHAALGEEAFHDLAKLYLSAYPSRTFSLRFVGEHLPAFLAGAIGEPFRRRWPFASDLATLEWAIVDVFDAADAPPLLRETLASVPAEAWDALRFELVPAHRLLSLDWPVQRAREAWDADHPLPELRPEATRVLVHRRGERVFHRAVSTVEANALWRLRDGHDFGSICAQIAVTTGDAEGPAHALGLVERWLADEILVALRS